MYVRMYVRVYVRMRRQDMQAKGLWEFYDLANHCHTRRMELQSLSSGQLLLRVAPCFHDLGMYAQHLYNYTNNALNKSENGAELHHPQSGPTNALRSS